MPRRSTNTAAPHLGPRLPSYPALRQLVRVTGQEGKVFSGLVQQWDGTSRLRDREQAYVFEANGLPLTPGTYRCRLVGSWSGVLGQVPLYACSVACCRPVFPLPSPSLSSASSLSSFSPSSPSSLSFFSPLSPLLSSSLSSVSSPSAPSPSLPSFQVPSSLSASPSSPSPSVPSPSGVSPSLPSFLLPSSVSAPSSALSSSVSSSPSSSPSVSSVSAFSSSISPQSSMSCCSGPCYQLVLSGLADGCSSFNGVCQVRFTGTFLQDGLFICQWQGNCSGMTATFQQWTSFAGQSRALLHLDTGGAGTNVNYQTFNWNCTGSVCLDRQDPPDACNWPAQICLDPNCTSSSALSSSMSSLSLSSVSPSLSPSASSPLSPPSSVSSPSSAPSSPSVSSSPSSPLSSPSSASPSSAGPSSSVSCCSVCIQFTLSGLAGPCAALNGTYQLNRGGTFPIDQSQPCVWSMTSGPSGAQAWLVEGFGGTPTVLYLGAAGPSSNLTLTYGVGFNNWDCSLPQTIKISNQPTGCNAPATLTLVPCTSLPSSPSSASSALSSLGPSSASSVGSSALPSSSSGGAVTQNCVLCPPGSIPSTIHATLSGGTGSFFGCQCLNGLVVAMTGGVIGWTGTAANPCGPGTISFGFQCSADNRWTFTMTTGGGTATGIDPVGTCNPFDFLFSSINMTPSGICTGTINVTVTM